MWLVRSSAFELRAQREPVQLRHHHIADNDIGHVVKSSVPSVGAVEASRILYSLVQVMADVLSDISVVFHDEKDRFRWFLEVRPWGFSGQDSLLVACEGGRIALARSSHPPSFCISLLANLFRRQMSLPQRETKGECCAPPFLALHRDRSLVQLHQFPRQGQPYPRPFLLPGMASINLIEAVKDPWYLLRRNANPRIAYAHSHILRSPVPRRSQPGLLPV